MKASILIYKRKKRKTIFLTDGWKHALFIKDLFKMDNLSSQWLKTEKEIFFT